VVGPDEIQAVTAKSAVLTSVDVMQSGDGIVEIGRAKLSMEPWRADCDRDGSEIRRLLATGRCPVEMARWHLESKLLRPRHFTPGFAAKKSGKR